MNEMMKRLAEDEDPEAFEELFRNFAPRVRAVMIRQGCKPELAEEVAQETLLTVWRKAHMFDPGKGAVSTWIFTIARNLRIDRLRKETPWQELPDEVAEREDDSAPADEQVAENQRRVILRKVLETLPVEQKQVVTLSYMDGLAHGDIAAKLDLPLGTVKSRMRLAAKKIREAMREVV